MHLRPRHGCPRDDLVRLVAGLKIVDHDTGLPQYAELGQDVVRSEGRPVSKDRSQYRQSSTDEPCHARYMDPTADALAFGR